MTPHLPRAIVVVSALLLGTVGCVAVEPGGRGEVGDASGGANVDAASGGSAQADCIVGRVVDGDSLDCEDGRRLRLLLIDSPELDQDPYGDAARRAMEVVAPVGTPVTLEYDIERQDDYDRELVYVTTLDGRSVNADMLRRGFAVVIVFPPNVREVDRYREIVDSARAARRGLWAVNGFECLPQNHRQGRCEA